MGFDPDAYLAKKDAAFNPDAYLAKKANSADMSSDLKNGFIGLQNGVTAGARPFIAGLGGAAGAAFAQLQDGNFSKIIPRAKEAFSDARKEAQNEQAKAYEESPKSYMLGEIGGGFLIPGGAVKTVAGTGNKLLQAARVGSVVGAGQALGNADTVAEGVKDVGVGAALGPVAELGIAGTGAAKNAITRKLESASAVNALKASGAMLKDYRALEGKGRVEEFGKFLIDNGLVKAGSTVESVANSSEALRKKAGDALELIYNKAQSVMPKNEFEAAASKIPGFNPVANKQEILAAAAEKLGDSEGSTNALNRLSKYLDTLGEKYGDTVLDPKKANDIKGHFDEVINYSRDPLKKEPDVEKAFHSAREFISGKINEGIEAVGQRLGDPALLENLKTANKLYGGAKQAGGMAKDYANRQNANHAFGLRQSILTGGGAGAGAVYGLASGGDAGDVIGGALKGAAAGASLKSIERYGPAILAKAEAVLADKINKSAALRRLIEKNPTSYQTMLQDTAKALSPIVPHPIRKIGDNN